jgi:serine O-acetyltransferase
MNSPPETDDIWAELQRDAQKLAVEDPLLEKFVQVSIIENPNVVAAAARILSERLATDTVPKEDLHAILTHALAPVARVICTDAQAYLRRDSACRDILTPFLFYKGFHATVTYRAAHRLWHEGKRGSAMWLQNRMTEVFSIDIHPAAQIDEGLMIDRGTGVVIGETAIIGKDVSIMQGVTLGGTGKETHDRHPIIRDSVLVSSGAKVLGRIEIGIGAKIGAGSVVLEDIPAYRTAVGVPAVVVGRPRSKTPSLDMDHTLNDDQHKQG